MIAAQKKEKKKKFVFCPLQSLSFDFNLSVIVLLAYCLLHFCSTDNFGLHSCCRNTIWIWYVLHVLIG